MESHSFTRELLALMYGWHQRTLKKKLYEEGIILPPGAITPRMVNLIFEKLGTPPYYQKYMDILYKR